ncbi:hypothetical protein [Microcoleus sp. FACHB-672]|nr:hypothetical protein [Microcoleus sp. FACHB-672]
MKARLVTSRVSSKRGDMAGFYQYLDVADLRQAEKGEITIYA